MSVSSTKLKITKRVVDAAEPTDKRFTVWDADLTGFGLRVEPSGSKSYIVRYRAGDGGRMATERLMTIGKPEGDFTPDKARDKAKALLAKATLGQDPAGERAKARKDLKVEELADLYLRDGCQHKKPATLYNDRSRVERHIKPLLGNKPLQTIDKAIIAKFQRDVAAGKTATAEHTAKGGRSVVTGGKRVAALSVNLLSAMFNFAIDHHIVKENPTIGVKRFETGVKERFLTSEELGRLGDAIREGEAIGIPWEPDPSKKVKHAPKSENRRTTLGPHVAGALRLLILTGCRLREILHLQWSEVDFERGMLFLGDSKTGKKAVVLNAPALAILTEMPRIGRYVIAGASAGQNDERPRSDLNRPWALVCKCAGLEGVRLHDLRHTNASFGAAAGLGLPIIGKLLGHTQSATTARYAHLDNDPLRKASERIGSDIARAMGEVSQKVERR